MLSITNLDSTQTINYNEDKIIALSGILSVKMKKVPVYLVNEQTMDRLYPPQKRILLDEECLKEFLNRREEGINEENLEEVFDKCSRETKSKAIAVGLYMRNIPDWLYNQFNDLKEPAIFICPERCISWGNSLNIPAGFVFTKVLFHEYAHAYLDVNRGSDYYNTSWGKIIEESLANYIAYSRFKSNKDKANVIKLISDQPLEYRGSLVLTEDHKLMPFCIPFWKIRDWDWRYIVENWRYIVEKIRERDWWYWRDLADELYYLYRKYGILGIPPFVGILPYGFIPNLPQIWKEYKKSNDKRLEWFLKHLALDLVKSLI